MKMIGNDVKISVIMPVYNAGDYLKKAIESVLAQTFGDFELILVDDGSTDDSPRCCDEFAKYDSRVVVIHKKNGGICNARNAGLKIARGMYVGFCDHDDEFHPEFLEKAFNRAVESNADVVKVSKNVLVTLNGKIVKNRGNCLPDASWGPREIKENFFLLFDYYDINCVWDGLFKKEIFDISGVKFDEFYKYGGEDYDLTAQYLPIILKLVTMKDVLYNHYVRYGVSTSSKFRPEKYNQIIYLNKKVFESSIKMGVDINLKKDVYNYFLTEFYLNPVTAILYHSACDYAFSVKKKMIKALWSENFMKEYFGKASVISVFKISKKNGLAYFLAKYKLITLYMLMHKFRIKQLMKNG